MAVSAANSSIEQARAGSGERAAAARGYGLAVAAVVALAVGVRLAYWWFQARSGAVQPGDSEEYYRAALRILQGGYDDGGKWLRPPFYPIFLALMFALGGVDVARALFGQAVLTGVGVLAFIALGGQLFGRRALAVASGLIAALFAPLASFGSVLFAEALFVALLVMGLAILDRAIVSRSARMALCCGLVLGLAALTRAVALFFIPLSALLVWLAATDRRGSARLAGMLLLGAALAIGPWAARNYLVHHRLILVDTNGGISMWYGMVQGEEDQRQGEARLAAVANLADRQSLAIRMTVERIQQNPGLFLSRVRFKTASLFLLQLRNFATGEIVSISPQDDQVVLTAGETPFWLTLISDVQYVLIMMLGIAGLAFAPSWRRALPVLLWVLCGTLLSSVTVAHPRLRLPIVGALIPFGAYALVMLPAALRARSRLLRDRRTLLALAGWLVFFGLIFSLRYTTWLRGERYAVQARNALQRGDMAAAHAAFERARAADPTNAFRALDLADLALAQHDLIAATGLYSQAATLEPRSIYAHAMRMRIAALLNRPDEARVELQAIAGYGRDSNDLYRWAWGFLPDSPPSRVVPGDATALGAYEGFAPATFDLNQGRWTLGEGRVRLRGECGVLRLGLRGPAGRIAQVWIEGQPLQQQVVLDGSAQRIALPLGDIPGCEARPPLVVHIRSATAVLDPDRAPWAVGVAVLDAQVEER
jgi:4-amino-4-deoxy-L-arabinose transferase-like glycosyltransferase